MLVSFIVPVFNPDGEILKKCIRSLKEQSYKDWEAIFVLDGPNMGAEAIISSFADKRIKIIEIPHGGACKARNEGQKISTGGLLWFWDCDCLIEPDSCKAFVESFEKNPTIDFIYAGYKFLGENGGIPSESFDPWTLQVYNYISTCFPMRRKVFPGWDETLESLQDWDIWLTIVERGGKGMFFPGYAFSTKLPDPDSISGKGCTNEAWLGRVKAIKVKHNLPDRKVCVSSIGNRSEGIRLAKLIDADYKDFPGYKPNNYDTIIQIGFSLNPKKVVRHSQIFNQPLKKKVIFWTWEDITEINNYISHKALLIYADVLNRTAIQLVEDKAAQTIMESAGFITKILPMPMVNTDQVEAFPESPRVLVDITEDYRHLVEILKYSMPDIQFDYISENKPVKDYSAILSLNDENVMGFPVKRMLLSGRNVIGNLQSPFCGYVNDTQEPGKVVTELVDTIRKRVKRDSKASVSFYNKALEPNKLLEVLK